MDKKNVKTQEIQKTDSNVDKSENQGDKTLGQKVKDTTSSLVDKLLQIIKKAADNYAVEKSVKYVDILLGGQFQDAFTRIVKEEILPQMDEDKKKKFLEYIKNDSAYKKSIKRMEANQRKDDVKDSNINKESLKYQLMWYGKKDDDKFQKVIDKILNSVKETAKQSEQAVAKLKNDLKEKGLKISDEDAGTYAPILIQMVADKKDGKEIQNKLNSLKKELNESLGNKKRQLLTEGREFTQEMIFEEQLNFMTTNEDFVNGTLYCLNEGIFGDVSKYVWDKIKSGGKKVGNTIVDVSSKTMEKITQYSIVPIYHALGLGFQAVTQGMIPTLIMKIMDAIQDYGDQVRNTFSRVYNTLVNMKGTAARMNFTLEDKKNKYSARYYLRENVWRIINTTDQNKHPSEEWISSIINGSYGKQFRDKLQEIWGKMFDNEKLKNVDIITLLKQVKGLNIPSKQLQMFKDFKDNYPEIKKNCIENPSIETRTKSSMDKNITDK